MSSSTTTGGAGDPSSTEEAPVQQEIFHLELHSWVEAQQASHGVRHDDYAQYHGYCTRRLARLSHHPSAKRHLVCSSKFATTVKRDTPADRKPSKHAFCSRIPDTLSATPGSDIVPHVNVLWYLLVLSERSWAHANQLQRQKKRRQQVLAKLKRAKGWANILLAKARHCCDPITIKECEAYASWMNANYFLEKLDHQSAAKEYAEAMALCYELSQTTTETNQEDAKRLERQDLFVTRADTVFRPLFRYCQYELKQAGLPLVEEPRMTSDSNSANQQQQTGEEGNEITIVFRKQELVLDSKELRVLLLKLQSMEQEESKAEDSQQSPSLNTEKDRSTTDEIMFINILSVLDDALEVVQGLLDTLEQAQVVGPAVQAKLQQYQLWKGYLQYQKTQHVIDHTANLLRNIHGHGERVHIYDALLQHTKTLLQLPRPQSQQGASVVVDEEEDEFALQAQANMLRLRACKTYHMAWFYYQTLQNYKGAWALLEQATKLCKRAQEEIAACDEDMPHAEEYLEELETLPLDSARAAIRAAWYLQEGSNLGESGGNGKRRNTNRPLLLRLQDDDAGKVLAGNLLPMPIPCKPVFFDLAYNYALDTSTSLDKIQAFVTEHTVHGEPEEEISSKSGGLFGWFSGSG